MSGFIEPSQLLMSVKEEIKEEEFDDFLQQYLFEIQKVKEEPGLEHDCKTEIYTASTLTCKEENGSLMDFKEEGESDSREYGQDDSSPASKQLNSLYSENIEKTNCVNNIYNT